MKCDSRPAEYQQPQRGADTPEQSSDGKRDLAERIFPQQFEAMPKIPGQEKRIAAERFVVDRHARNIKIEPGRDDVNSDDEGDRQLWRSVDAGVNEGHIPPLQHGFGYARADEDAADDCSQNNSKHGQAFHPAVSQYQLSCRQIFGKDAVFGRRISRRTQADQAVSEQRIDTEQHGETAEDFDVVADEHYAPLGQRVGERAHKRGEHDVGKNKCFLQNRRMPIRRM